MSLVIVRPARRQQVSWRTVSDQQMVLTEISARDLLEQIQLTPVVHDSALLFPIQDLPNRIQASIRAADRQSQSNLASILRGLGSLVRDGLCYDASDIIFYEIPIRTRVR